MLMTALNGHCEKGSCAITFRAIFDANLASLKCGPFPMRAFWRRLSRWNHLFTEPTWPIIYTFSSLPWLLFTKNWSWCVLLDLMPNEIFLRGINHAHFWFQWKCAASSTDGIKTRLENFTLHSVIDPYAVEKAINCF